MLQWFSDKKRMGVAWLLLFLMLFTFVAVPIEAKADKLPTGLIRKEHDSENNKFLIVGRHNYTDGVVWTYKTTAFNVANGKCSDITNPPSDVKVTRLPINEIVNIYEVSGEDKYTNSTYIMTGAAFANAFQTLYQKEIDEAVARGDKTYTDDMYFNNIFKVVYRTDPGKTGNYNGAVMNPKYSFQSTEEYHTASQMAGNPYVSAWSTSDFAGFYNYAYTYTVNILETVINYVDRKTGEVLKSEAAKVHGLKNATGRYTLTEKEITVNDKRYVYSGSFKTDKKDGSVPVEVPSSDGTFRWKIANDGMVIDIFFTEDDSKVKIPVKLHTRIKEGTEYVTVKCEDYGTAMYNGEELTYAPAAAYTAENGSEYVYAKRWSYTYTDEEGTFYNKGTNPNGKEIPSFYIPKVKEGSVLNIYMDYDLNPKEAEVKVHTQISEDGSTYTTVKSEDKGKVKEAESFSLVVPKSHTEGLKKYDFKEWYYTYTEKNGSVKIVPGEGDMVNIPKIPLVKDGTRINVYLKYRYAPGDVPVKLHTEISEDGSSYHVLKTENKGTVKEGAGFSVTVPETFCNDDKDYIYKKVWRYTYTDRNGNFLTVDGMSEKPQIETVPLVQEGTELNIYVRYDRIPVKIRVKLITSIRDSEDVSYHNVKTEEYPLTFLPGDSFSYTAPLSHTEDGKDYAYENGWKYNYTDEAGNLVSVAGKGHPFVGSLPKIKKNTYVTVYMKYGYVKEPIEIKIHTCISEDGTEYSVAKSEVYTGAVKEGDRFSVAVSESCLKDGTTYRYTKKWYYRYMTVAGAEKKVTGADGHPTIPSIPKVQGGSVINVFLKYDRVLEPSATPTPSATLTPSITPSVTPSPTPSTTLTPSVTPSVTPTPVITAPPTPTPTPTPAKKPSSNQEAPENLGSYTHDVPEPYSTAKIEAEEKYNWRYSAKDGIATQEDLYAEGNASEYVLGYGIRHVTGTKTYQIRVEKTYILQWEGPDPPKEETAEDADGAAGGEGESGGAGGESAEGGENEEEAKPKILTDEVTVSTYVYVTRGYGYWEIDDFGFYVPDNLKLYNYALPDGNVTIPATASKLTLPVAASTDYDDNIDPPLTYKEGIVLPPEIINSGTKRKPLIPQEAFETLAYNAAHEYTQDIKVRNDHLYFDGTVLPSYWINYEAPVPDIGPLWRTTGANIGELFYKGNMVIDATKDNGVNYSAGTITYRAHSASVGVSATKYFNLSVEPNQVTIHTPVYCDGIITADNDRYVQLSNPNNAAVHLVLDEDDTLNDFVVRVNNTGQHLILEGYSVRDFSKILRAPDSILSHIEKNVYGNLRNEVKFPFDTYMDVGNDYEEENDLYCSAGTWVTLDRISQRFYLPLTVREGIYSAEFRTIAVNANGRLKRTQGVANTDRNNYVATDTVLMEVSGRVYGLSVYDINDYPFWEEVFRIPGTMHYKINNQDAYPLDVYEGGNAADYAVKSYDYTVGTKDSYGNPTGRVAKYTLPLVSGSHPRYGNLGILKRGYSVRFTLDTIGTYYDDSVCVVAYPTYYWLDKDGKNRTKVDMYYTAEVQGKLRRLVKCGEAIDLANIVRRRPGDRRNMGIPEDELSVTAAIQRLLAWQWGYQWDNLVYGASKVSMGYRFRTFTGSSYADRVLNGPNKTRIKNAGVTEEDLIVSKQSWYGEAFIPGTARFVSAGTDVHGYAARYGIDYTESFWKTDGYIIMNLDIKVYDRNGKERLSYVNKANESRYCNMWRMEGALIGKSDAGTALYFEDGDFMIYSVEKSATDDYVVGGIY